MAWLLGRGYEVFLGVGLTSCDMVVLTPGGPRRIEVKKATPVTTRIRGIERYCVANVQPEKFDDLLVVLPVGTVVLNPTRAQMDGIPPYDAPASPLSA